MLTLTFLTSFWPRLKRKIHKSYQTCTTSFDANWHKVMRMDKNWHYVPIQNQEVFLTKYAQFSTTTTNKLLFLGPPKTSLWSKKPADLKFTNNSWTLVQGVKSLGGQFACLRLEFDFYEVKKYYYFSKRKGKYFYCWNKRAIIPKWINS